MSFPGFPQCNRFKFVIELREKIGLSVLSEQILFPGDLENPLYRQVFLFLSLIVTS